MEKKPTASSKKNWNRRALKLLAALVGLALADLSGGLLWAFDRSLQHVGAYSHHVSPHVQVRVSARVCALFSNVPTGVPMRALTLGRTIFVPDSTHLPMPASRVRHELRHVRQWEARGVLGFALTYSFWQLVGGYDRNPMERNTPSS